MIKLLIKNRLVGILAGAAGKGKQTGKNRGNAAFVAVLLCFLVACFLFISATLAFALGAVLIPEGASWLYFAIFILAALSVLFVFSIFETKSELFDCKDNELLLSMPVSERAIVVSRLFVVLIINYLTEAIVFLPAIVVYAIFAASPVGVIGALLVALFIPLVATALASGVGYLVAIVARRFKNNSWLSLAISLGFLALYFWGYNALLSGVEGFLESFEPESLVGKLKALEFIGNAALMKPLPLVAFVAVSVAISALAFFIIEKNYVKLATSGGNTKKAAAKSDVRRGSRSPLSALVAKELGKFFSSSTYMLNSALGGIFAVVASVAALVEREELIALAAELLPAAEPVAVLAPVLSVLIVAISTVSNSMSASALSLEGKNLWIMRTLPVDERTLLLSKALPQMIVSAPFTLVSSVLLMIATGATPLYGIFLLLTPVVASVFSAFLGLSFNVLSPRFDFDNEAQPIKQSLPVFLTMLSEMLIAAAISFLVVIMTLVGLGLAASFIALGLFAALSVIFGFVALGPCAKKCAALSV